jgi:citrate lyase subunit beta/citryl-CoA lyase
MPTISRRPRKLLPKSFWCPKVSNSDTLELIGRRLLDMGTDHKTRIWAMIETPLAIFNILSIAAVARDSETRLAGFVMGTNDLAKDTRARLVPGPAADARMAFDVRRGRAHTRR